MRTICFYLLQHLEWAMFKHTARVRVMHVYFVLCIHFDSSGRECACASP